MDIPISWLKEAANINDETATLLEKMTDAGNTVDGLAKLGEDITNVIVGKIVSLERHPDADKLWVTQTDVGKETLQIVTGADNLKVGDYIPVAIHGSTLANGIKIKKSKMRGVESNGMLCSISELGYTTADFPEAVEEGIYVFDKDVLAECIKTGPHKTSLSLDELLTLGADARIAMELCEDVADFDILSNRPDTNSIMGMAREAAAVYNQPFHLPEITLKESAQGQVSDYVTVEIKDPERCPRYIARVVENVRIGPSPQWMRRRLSTAGLRPINNIVDITNYVMLEYGQPLHAFDISAVAKKDGKHHIVVRTANDGETFTTLDGTERKLLHTHLLIADHEKPIGIAGIMGGENSMIRDTTTTILFESANFDSANIRQTSRNLGMRTDASARYEKGQDPNQALTSVNRAMQLVEELCCGDVVPGMVDVYPTPREPQKVRFAPLIINHILGIDEKLLSREDICNYLHRVGIKTREITCAELLGEGRGGDNILVGYESLIPTFRADISGEADLAEEVVRFYGLNNIPAKYEQILSGQLSFAHDGTNHAYQAGKTPRRRREDRLKHTMAALGYNEALTYPFESPKVLDKLMIPQDDAFYTQAAIHLKNPLGEDFSVMRITPLDGLLESLSRNQNKGNASAALFEIANTYGMIQGVPKEFPHLTFAAYGTDFLSVKGDVETLISTITNKPAIFATDTHGPWSFMHPGRSAHITMKTSPNPKDEHREYLGCIGELHPQVAKNYNLNTRVVIAMLHLTSLHQIAESQTFKYVAPSMYPPLDRDIALKVRDNVSAAELESAIRERGGQLLADVTLFDVYKGKQVGEGYKSMAYSLRFRAADRTLTVEDVQKPIQSILENLEKKCEAEVRA